MDIMFYLVIILLIVFLLSGLAIITKGFINQKDEDHFISIMLASGFF